MALKRLVTSAATVALLGCSDGAQEQGAPPPPFSGSLPNQATVEQPPVIAPVDTANPAPEAPAAAEPAPATSGAGASEGQTPVGIAPPEAPGAESSGSESSMGTEAGAQPATGMEPTGTDAPPVEEEPAPVPEEEEPAPIVRPALDCGAPAPALQGAGIQGCQAEAQGSVGGQDWFLWFTGGSGCMTTFDNLSGAFTAQWNNPGDFLARIGFWFDETQTFEQLGEIGADLRFTRQGSAGGFSFIGIYGWTTDPLVEYYIVEDSFGNGPAQPFNTQMRGSFSLDGAQYNMYSGARQNLPAITGGNANFTQVLSVRQNPRQCGHVSISEHFRRWEQIGVNLGNAKEAKVLVESGGGNGSITFTHANITVTAPD